MAPVRGGLRHISGVCASASHRSNGSTRLDGRTGGNRRHSPARGGSQGVTAPDRDLLRIDQRLVDREPDVRGRYPGRDQPGCRRRPARGRGRAASPLGRHTDNRSAFLQCGHRYDPRIYGRTSARTPSVHGRAGRAAAPVGDSRRGRRQCLRRPDRSPPDSARPGAPAAYGRDDCRTDGSSTGRWLSGQRAARHAQPDTCRRGGRGCAVSRSPPVAQHRPGRRYAHSSRRHRRHRVWRLSPDQHGDRGRRARRAAHDYRSVPVKHRGRDPRAGSGSR